MRLHEILFIVRHISVFLNALSKIEPCFPKPVISTSIQMNYAGDKKANSASHHSNNTPKVLMCCSHILAQFWKHFQICSRMLNHTINHIGHCYRYTEICELLISFSGVQSQCLEKLGYILLPIYPNHHYRYIKAQLCCRKKR